MDFTAWLFVLTIGIYLVLFLIAFALADDVEEPPEFPAGKCK